MFCLKKLLLLVAGLTLSVTTIADTYYELGAGASTYALNITRKRGENFEDESRAMTFSIGAYRESTHNSYWGAVIDLVYPQGREESLSGNGRILGFRPINYLVFFNDSFSVELYAGAAQYEWRKTANGYYFGSALRYNFRRSHWSVMLDTKFFQDLAFDSPEGDDIVQGFNPGLKILYRF